MEALFFCQLSVDCCLICVLIAGRSRIARMEARLIPPTTPQARSACSTTSTFLDGRTWPWPWLRSHGRGHGHGHGKGHGHKGRNHGHGHKGHQHSHKTMEKCHSPWELLKQYLVSINHCFTNVCCCLFSKKEILRIKKKNKQVEIYQKIFHDQFDLKKIIGKLVALWEN